MNGDKTYSLVTYLTRKMEQNSKQCSVCVVSNDLCLQTFILMNNQTFILVNDQTFILMNDEDAVQLFCMKFSTTEQFGPKCN